MKIVQKARLKGPSPPLAEIISAGHFPLALFNPLFGKSPQKDKIVDGPNKSD
jgi:hypothetical protein